MKEIVMELREISCAHYEICRQMKRLADIKDKELERKRMLTPNEHREVHKYG